MAVADRPGTRADTGWGVERHALRPVPETDRHGSPRSLFTLWFPVNVTITAAIAGAVPVAVGAHPVSALLALTLGTLLGAVPMALHAVQGPRLGVPQMVQSRIQFGVYGALVPLAVVIVMYVGFFATGTLLGAQAVAAVLPVPIEVGILGYALLSALCALLGYRLIHRLGRLTSLLSLVVFGYLWVRLAADPAVPVVLADPAFEPATFAVGVALAASWQLSFGPMVADTSRYLPTGTPAGPVFWYTYAGSSLGALLAMSFGTLAAAVLAGSFRGREVEQIVGVGAVALAGPLLLAIALGKLVVNVLGVYGGYLSVAAALPGVSPHTSARTAVRATIIGLVCGAGCLLAILARQDFLGGLHLLLEVLLYLIGPWSAINLVDFYVVRRRAGPDPATTRVGYRRPALLAYALGIVAQVPVVRVGGFTGPVVPLLDGVDIAWLVGLGVPALAYGLLTRREAAVTRGRPTPADHPRQPSAAPVGAPEGNL